MKHRISEILQAAVVLAALAAGLLTPEYFRVSAEQIGQTGQIAQSEQAERLPTSSGKSLPDAETMKFPLLFEENAGQTDKSVKYFARANSYRLFLTNNEAVFTLKDTDQIKLNFVGGNKDAEIMGENQAVTVSNYFTGQDKSKWLTDIPNFTEVWQKGIYNGIDAKFYGIENKQLEYDFIVSPNADANQIKLNFDGAKNVSLDEQGNLVLKTDNAELVQNKPIAYQVIEGKRREVAVSYNLTENKVSFSLGDYDKSQTLIIDPIVSYLSYIGGANPDVVDNAAIDAQGNAFIVGTTASLDFPVPNSRSSTDFAVYVSKISADGSTILYNTFLDGEADDGFSGFSGFNGNDIAIDASGNAYIAGITDSGDFPISDNAYQRVRLCNRQFGSCLVPQEVFITKLNATGGIVYSTYLGGRTFDYANGIAVDSTGKAYVTGGTDSGLLFPTKNAYQGTGVFGNIGNNGDAFITVLNASGSDILYSSGLSGNNNDSGNGIALDSSNNVYITGFTESTNDTFPTKSAFQPNSGGRTEAFVAKFNTSLSGESSLLYSTLLGGTGTERGNGIAINSSNQPVVVGVTGSANFPLLNAFDTTNQINEAFVSVISSNGTSLVNSSFLGGADQEEARGVALDNFGNIYVTGSTQSNNFPLALPFQATRVGNRDAFVTKVKFGTGVISSSYLGGSGFDSGKGIAVRNRDVFVVGATKSNNLATTDGVIRETFGGGDIDGFVAKILDTRLDSVGVFRPITTFSLTQSITNVVAQNATFTSLLSGAQGVSGDWNGDGIDSIGSFTNGAWKFRNVNFAITNPFGVNTANFGLAGDLPIVGDWNGDGIDTFGTFRPSTGQFFLTNTINAAAVDVTASFGLAGDIPVAGDFDGDGFDSFGVFRPSNGAFILANDVNNPAFDVVAFFGTAGDLPFTGDFDGNGTHTVGVWRPSTAEFFLSNDNINIARTFVFGAVGTDQPIVGDWDGLPLP
jgi:hypothetical protein